jgi:hypothetical protein
MMKKNKSVITWRRPTPSHINNSEDPSQHRHKHRHNVYAIVQAEELQNISCRMREI